MESHVTSYELQIILKELGTNQVALKANGIIPVTYSVVTSVREAMYIFKKILQIFHKF